MTTCIPTFDPTSDPAAVPLDETAALCGLPGDLPRLSPWDKMCAALVALRVKPQHVIFARLDAAREMLRYGKSPAEAAAAVRASSPRLFAVDRSSIVEALRALPFTSQQALDRAADFVLEESIRFDREDIQEGIRWARTRHGAGIIPWPSHTPGGDA